MALTTIRVALRVRPFNEKELKETNQPENLITFVPGQPQQISIDQDRRHFTFDYVYPSHKSQADVYQSCIQPLFDQFVNGYNATILAYGQTGSGKTYSMGTSATSSSAASMEHIGIVPRFAENLFSWIECQRNQHNNNTIYSARVSFLELYNEDIIDLLNNGKDSTSITIRENTNGNISWSGVQEESIQSSADLLSCLSRGSVARTTASTDMNASSSRSHAIFSVSLIQIINLTVENNDSITKTLESKFHFVDLAGSERLKKTNAVGDRAKEGISINSGLLALSNVISALGDESRRQQQHIPYRNSKLTRLLQDSLGGNSQTLMLACVSPAGTNANETLSTLKYANRAKNITNTVVLNQQQSLTDTLKEEIAHLKEEMRINDAFIKEVHVELDDLRAKNTALESLIYNKNNNGLPDSVEGNTKTDETGKLTILTARSQQQIITKKSPVTSVIKNTNDLKEDDQVALVDSSANDNMHVSTSTKRKRKSTSTNQVRKRVAAAAAAAAATATIVTENDQNPLLLSLDKHKYRMKKEYLFIKQIKNQSNLVSDPNKITKLINMFLSSIREQKQLVQLVEQSNKQSPPTVAKKSPFSSIPVNKKKEFDQSKPSFIKQPTAVSLLNTTSDNFTNTLMLEHQMMSCQLKQIMAAIKKAMVMINNPSTSLAQLKPILNRAALIYTQHSNSSNISHDTSSTTNGSSTTTTKSNKNNNSVRVQNKSNIPTTGLENKKNVAANKKRVNIEDVRSEIKRIVSFEHIKVHPICLEMLNSLKQQKIKLMREQKDLLKERHEMLKEFYKDDFTEQQQKQQYMDERIDTITVQVDLLTEHIKLLTSASRSVMNSNNKNNHSLIDILKHLKEGDLRALILLIIQQDLVSFNLQSQVNQHTLETLHKFQQGMVQLRRTSDEINNQVLMDLLKSPIRCLSNGLVLISGK